MDRFRIKFRTAWTGKKDSESEAEKYKPGQLVDVDMDTFRALVFTHNIAEAVPVDKIQVEAEEEKKPPVRRASNKRIKPDDDKMQKAAKTK